MQLVFEVGDLELRAPPAELREERGRQVVGDEFFVLEVSDEVGESSEVGAAQRVHEGDVAEGAMVRILDV
jgi:hypothetical protein